jgi:hypothetical protein
MQISIQMRLTSLSGYGASIFWGHPPLISGPFGNSTPPIFFPLPSAPLHDVSISVSQKFAGAGTSFVMVGTKYVSTWKAGALPTFRIGMSISELNCALNGIGFIGITVKTGGCLKPITPLPTHPSKKIVPLQSTVPSGVLKLTNAVTSGDSWCVSATISDLDSWLSLRWR